MNKEERYNELNAIREHGVFTYDEAEEWIKISTEILLDIMKENEELLYRMKNNEYEWDEAIPVAPDEIMKYIYNPDKVGI